MVRLWGRLVGGGHWGRLGCHYDSGACGGGGRCSGYWLVAWLSAIVVAGWAVLGGERLGLLRRELGRGRLISSLGKLMIGLRGVGLLIGVRSSHCGHTSPSTTSLLQVWPPANTDFRILEGQRGHNE